MHTLLLPPIVVAVQDACSALQLCAASLRRAVADVGKMRKAPEKVRQQVAKTKSAMKEAPPAELLLDGRISPKS